MTATAPAAIIVPHEFLPTFVSAATVRLLSDGDGLNSLSLDFSDRNRRSDDAKIATTIELVVRLAGEREAVLRGLDHGEAVPVAILQACAADALEDLRGTVAYLADASRHDGDLDPEQIAAKALLLRDLTAWCAENDVAPDAVTA
jgi:hypothetical protein